MDPFIWVRDKVLPAKFCKQVIKKFDMDTRSRRGVTSLGLQPEIKRSLDLKVSTLEDWRQEDQVFFAALGSNLLEYQKHIDKVIPDIPIFNTPDIKDTGYQIQKTSPGEEYTWHQDSCVKDGYARALTYIWYLNNVPEGGETEFYDGTLIKPVQGRMLIFPATWTFMHRGRTPASDKYIATGWMVSKQRTSGE